MYLFLRFLPIYFVVVELIERFQWVVDGAVNGSWEVVVGIAQGLMVAFSDCDQVFMI